MRAMNHNDMLSLCSEFKYEKFSAGDIVVKKGDHSNEKFYVIISGQVGIMTPNEDADTSNRACKFKLERRKNHSMIIITEKDENNPETLNANNPKTASKLDGITM